MIYEYKTETWPSGAPARLVLLNQMGAEGWRLGQIIGATAYFERERKEDGQ